jgi:hypothetical protein
MIKITVDDAALNIRLTEISQSLNDLDQTMPAELTAWQREDMNREYPNTTAPDRMTAFTLIWPRSRKRRLHRKPQRRRVYLRQGRQPASQRSLLRPELFEKLCERMTALLHKTVFPHGG